MSTLGTENTSRCPLCDGPNDCQLCTTSAYKGPCWCISVEFTWLHEFARKSIRNLVNNLV